jgi:hypothetical protein
MRLGGVLLQVHLPADLLLLVVVAGLGLLLLLLLALLHGWLLGLKWELGLLFLWAHPL